MQATPPALYRIDRNEMWLVLVVSTAIEALILAEPAALGSTPTTRLWTGRAFEATLLGLPILGYRFALHRPLRDVGLGFPKTWGRSLLVLTLLAWITAVLATRVPSIHSAYPLLSEAREHPLLLLPWTVGTALYGLAWEGFFRGFVMFGLRSRLGLWAIVVQAVPCAILHWGKPWLELGAALPGAIFLGAIAYGVRSVLPGLVLHVGISVAVNLACVLWPLR